MIIWAKLTQGNGRGTCCWITHNLKVIKQVSNLNYIYLLHILRIVALSEYLDIMLGKV
jgi:hypothetical protein